ncbi:MAG: transposase [Candidatus Scalinduaceae bacterium]
MNRGLNQYSIFLHDSDYELFITVVKEACKLFNVFVSSYCLLPNHYHLLLCTPEGNLGRFMRHLNGVYTQRHNRKHKKDGPLFRGRYKATLVQEEEYLTRVVRYIHRNPLNAKMVDNLSSYQWSSHKVYEWGKSKEDWLDIDIILECFSNKRKQAVKIYKNFVEEATDSELEKFYSKRNQSSILGEEGFIKNIKERFLYSDKDLKVEIKEKKEIQSEGRIEKINREVCNIFRVSDETLYTSTRGEENIPRNMAISLSRELSGFQFPGIAKKYKISTYRTVGTICFRFREKLMTNKKLAKQYKILKESCSQEWT